MSSSESDTVTCYYNETWSTEVPVCECNVGYENMGTNCSGKSINTIQRTKFLHYVSLICHHEELIKLRMKG